MAITTFSELKRKELINICDGARLGSVCDLELDDCTGVVSALIAPGPSRFMGLFRGAEEIVIPYCKIQKIGGDVILVQADGV